MSFTDLETIADLFAEAQERHEGSIRADVLWSGGLLCGRAEVTSGRKERPHVSAAGLLRAVLTSMRMRRRGFVLTWLQRDAMILARSRALARWDPGRVRPSLKRLVRRSAKDLAAVTARIVAFVKEHPGLRAEQIGAELAIDRREWKRPLDAGLGSKKLTKRGRKRATTYYAS